jgi:anti-sigma regulatory factor (Ser/Thr protein kinase)
MAEILQLELQRRPSSVGLARDAARVVLSGVCDDQQLDDVLTVISELVTNAVRHTGGGCSLTLLHDGDQVVVEVRDTDTRPLHRNPDEGTLGHGLGVVQSLATRWGIDRMSDGKCVWAEMSVAMSGAR